MAPDPTIMQAVETLNYRVTAGDIASQAGLDIKLAEQGLLVLASEAGGHLQVSDSGEVAYLFPKDFRSVLRSKHFRLRLQEWWQRIWGVLFYLIRISFGILLIASIVIIVLAIIAILIALSASRGEGDSDRGGSSDGGMVFVPNVWFGGNWYWIFLPDYGNRSPERRRYVDGKPEMNFLESVFSFLFGDGNPNADLEERRWRAIATVIRNNGGAIVAEQVVPYLDNLGKGYSQEFEDYMIPVLTRFNGRPEVSPDGQLVYHFPELQVTADRRNPSPVAAYLKEQIWRFSKAGRGQLVAAASLGIFNFVAALVLGAMLLSPDVQQLTRQVDISTGFVATAYGVLLAYGTGFVTIPAVRYFTLRGRNRKVETRNEMRQQRAELLNAAEQDLQEKLAFAQQFVSETVVSESDLAYTTERDLTEQELEQSDKIDEEWRRRLEQSGT